MITAYDLDSAGFCMFGLHGRDVPEKKWPTVSHDVVLEGHPAFRTCSSCARAYEACGAVARPIGRGSA